MLQKIKQYLDQYIAENNINNSLDIVYSNKQYDHIIGQDHAVSVIKQAMRFKRHVLMIGLAGTGKSLLAKCSMTLWTYTPLKIISTTNMVQLTKPKLILFDKPFDFISYVDHYRYKKITVITLIKWYIIASIISTIVVSYQLQKFVLCGFLLPPSFLLGVLAFYPNLYQMIETLNSFVRSFMVYDELAEGTCIYSNELDKSSFIDATGSNSAALLGDVSHDPLDGLHAGDPYSDRKYKLLRAGAVHKAHKGVLYIDEIGTLDLDIQYSLLTILENKEAGIAPPRTNNSSGVASHNKLPCDFCLIMAGNHETVKKIHSALRSRIKGYGYEVIMNESMPVTYKNTVKLLEFIARELKKGGHLPFTNMALYCLLCYATTLSRVPNQYTLELRHFKGIFRIASDYGKMMVLTIIDANVLRQYLKNDSIEAAIGRCSNATFMQRNIVNRKPGLLLFKTSEGETKTGEIVPYIVNISYTPVTYRGIPVLISAFRHKFNDTDSVNCLEHNSTQVLAILEKFIKPAPNTSLSIFISEANSIYRFILEVPNCIFSIVGQYYQPLDNTVYIGELDINGLITTTNKTMMLIEEALMNGLKVITAKSLEWYYGKDLSVSYITYINELTGYEQNGKWG